MRKYILFVAFGLMVLFQWLVPATMIWNRENIIRQNQVYLFETEPVDPHDAFRGKYVVLGFKENKVPYDYADTTSFEVGQEVFVEVDSYAETAYLTRVFATEPTDLTNYFKTTILYIDEEAGQITVNTPFNRYYMNEEKSLRAEQILRNNNLKAYAQVAIYKGEVVLKDVLVDGISLKDFVETYQEQDSIDFGQEEIIENTEAVEDSIPEIQEVIIETPDKK